MSVYEFCIFIFIELCVNVAGLFSILSCCLLVTEIAHVGQIYDPVCKNNHDPIKLSPEGVLLHAGLL